MEDHLKPKGPSSWNPMTILREAIRAVPAMKYALAVLGLVAVVAIVATWNIDFKVAVFGSVIILVLMVAILVFAKLTQIAPRYFLAPARFFMWAFVVLTTLTGFSLLSAAALKVPAPLYELLFGGKSGVQPTRTVSPPVVEPAQAVEPPPFVTVHVYPADNIERVEFTVDSNSAPAGGVDDLLRLNRLVFGTVNSTSQVFQVEYIIRNATKEPVLLDLDERFFSMEDDLGNAAKLIYFCCKSKGDALPPGQERTAELFFENRGWQGKSVKAHWIYVRSQGFLPVVRAVWRVRPLITRD